MSVPSSPLLAPVDVPRTADGKRNFAWSAVHPGEKPSSAATVPEANGVGFWALLDVINPLQHIPIVGSIYRAITGDTISAPGRIFGDLLFGGPLGFLTGIAGTLFAEIAAPAPTNIPAQTAVAAYSRTTALPSTTRLLI